MTREEAIKRLKEARFTVQPYLYMNEAFDVAIEALSQPERPKGRWIERIRFSIADYTCSKCGCWTGDKHNYCPDCGADMRDGEEE